MQSGTIENVAAIFTIILSLFSIIQFTFKLFNVKFNKNHNTKIKRGNLTGDSIRENIKYNRNQIITYSISILSWCFAIFIAIYAVKITSIVVDLRVKTYILSKSLNDIKEQVSKIKVYNQKNMIDENNIVDINKNP